MSASNPIRRASIMDGRAGVHSSSANYAVCSAGFFFSAFILAVVGLAANMNWIEGTVSAKVVQITANGNTITETITEQTTAVTGTLSYASASTYQVVTRSSNAPAPSPLPVPLPSPRPSTTNIGNPVGFLNGQYYFSALNANNVCSSTAMEGDLVCAGLRALYQGAGWTITLEVALAIVSALGFVSAYGLSKRLTAAESDPAAKAPRGPGTWAWLCGLRFDQAFSTFIIGLFASALGVMFIISWPSVIATWFNNVIAYQKSQIPATLPTGTTYSYSSNPAPAAGYYIVFTGCLCVFVAFAYSFVLYGASFCGKGGCLSVPPSGAPSGSVAVAVASPLHASAPAPVVVGGGAYLGLPPSTPQSSAAEHRAAYAPEASNGVPVKA